MADTQPTAPPSSPSPWKTWHYVVLWIVAILSLVLNVLLFAGLYAFRLRAQQEIGRVQEFLSHVEIDSYDLEVVVDETLPIRMTVPFSDTFVVPISDSIAISTEVLFEDTFVVPIDTVIPLNNNITVAADIPVVGRVPIPIPIVTNIPVNFTVEVPVSRTIPIDTEIPIEMMVDVPINTEIPIDTEVPVQLNLPVSIPLDEMGFNILLGQVKGALEVLADALGV